MTALLLAFLLLTPPSVPAEQALGSITLVQGPLTLIRGTNVYRGVEGMSLKRGDILETADGGFAQLEFSGGIVALGTSTRVYLLPSGGTSGGKPITLDFIVLNGWLKSETAGGKGLIRVRTSLLSATASGGAIVVRSGATTCEVFLESGGPLSISEVNASGETGYSTQAKTGQFVARQKGAPLSALPRPSPDFLAAVPKEFRDTLPSRAARFSDKPAAVKMEHAVSYDEIESWLKMPAAWRRGLADRFSPRLADSNFRRQIESHVREFPEWEPLLHPKKSSESL